MLGPRLTESLSAWIKVYSGSRVFWDDWLDCIYIETATACSVASTLSILEHLMLLFLLYILGMKHNFISCWWGLSSYTIEASVACGLEKKAASERAALGETGMWQVEWDGGSLFSPGKCEN